MKFSLNLSVICLVLIVSVYPASICSQTKKTASPKATPTPVKPANTQAAKPSQTIAPTNPKPPIKQPEKFANSDMEKAVLEELNLARRDPQNYVRYLEEYRKLYKGNTIFNPNFERIETNEGTAAVDEAIAFLKTLSPVESYKFSDGLNKAAAVQLGDLIENSSLGHTSKDGSDLPTRLARFGKATGRNAENIAFYAASPRNIVMRMIIDDGLKTRGHRKNVFSSDLKLVGIAYGKGKSGEGLCVVDFAANFTEHGKPSTTVLEF